MKKLIYVIAFNVCIWCSATASAVEVVPLSICGPSTGWQDVNLYDGTLGVTKAFVSAHKETTGLLTKTIDTSLYEAKSTGILIAKDLFLTAAHNIVASSEIVTQDNQGDIIAGIDVANLHIIMSYEVTQSGSIVENEQFSVSKIEELLQFDDNNGTRIDYAILRVDGKPGSDFNVAHLSGDLAAINQTVTIIQHPLGLPKKVHVGLTDGYGDIAPYIGLLRHAVDTSSGSSGSAIVDAYGRTIALHTKAGCDADQAANHGLLIVDIKNYSNTINALMTDDSDNDGLRGDIDNCPGTYNLDQMDLDGDGYGNVCDREFIAAILTPIVTLLLN